MSKPLTTEQLRNLITTKINNSTNKPTAEYWANEIMAAVKDHVDYVMGEDAKQDWDDEQCYCRTCNYQPTESRECICVINNQLKAEQRNRAGAY